MAATAIILIIAVLALVQHSESTKSGVIGRDLVVQVTLVSHDDGINAIERHPRH
jgi:hypothetical protein